MKYTAKNTNKIIKNLQTPFPELDIEIEFYRNTLADAIKKNYIEANKEGIPLGHSAVQIKIYRDFINKVTLPRIQQFHEQYHKALIVREKRLKEDFEETITEVKNWDKYNPITKKWEKYNTHLSDKPTHFIKVKATYDNMYRDEKITEVENYLSEKEIIEKINSYYQYDELKKKHDKKISEARKLPRKEKEKKLEELAKEKPQIYIPLFEDKIDDFDVSKLRVYASLNIAVLLNPEETMDSAWNEVKFKEYKSSKPGYVIIDRLKAGSRQASKFVDTLITDEEGETLRAVDDKSYDFAGITVKINNGEELYRLINFFLDKSTIYPEFDNMYTLEQNKKISKDTLRNPLNKKPIQKLRKDFYTTGKTKERPHLQLDTENYMEVMQQMLALDKIITQRMHAANKKGEIYKLSEAEKEGVRQGAKLGITNGTFPVEVQIGTREMLWIQQYGNIRHELFIPERETIRMEYLLNPANSPHRKILKKRAKENPNKNNPYVGPTRLASVNILAEKLEELFTPSFVLPDYQESRISIDNNFDDNIEATE